MGGGNCDHYLNRVMKLEGEGVEPQCLPMIQVNDGDVELRWHLHHSELTYHLVGEEW